jgi:hypothetical protein
MFIASLLHLGMTMPAPLPWAGQIAPNSHARTGADPLAPKAGCAA